MSDDTPGQSSGRWVEAGPGDTIPALAHAHGLFWQTVWDHPDNEALREQREDPNCLVPGDAVFIPDIEQRSERVAVDQRHSFVRRGVPSTIRIQLFRPPAPRPDADTREALRSLALRSLLADHDEAEDHEPPELEGEIAAPEPWADVPYEATIHGVEHVGAADGDGLVEIVIPPGARRGQLRVAPDSEDERVIELALGQLEPVTTERGLWQRLTNLGYACGASLEEFEQLRASVLLHFAQTHELEPTGEADDDTRAAVRDAHGR